MNTVSILLLCVAISLQLDFSYGQCSSQNKVINETNIGNAVRQLINGNMDFSLKLMKTIEYQARNDKNKEGSFFSSFSIWSALMVTYMGAKGRTESQLQKILGVENNADKETIWNAYQNLLNWNVDRQVHPQQSYQIANKIYFQDGTPVQDCLKRLMSSEIEFTDFKKNPELARSKINQWVTKTTRGKIQDLLPPNSLTDLTKMIITNAVYFKENWAIKFDSAKTKPRSFILPYKRSNYLVNMMSLKGQFLYGKSRELQCTGLELPYDGNDLSMLVLVPDNNYGLNTLVDRLTSENLRNLIDDMYPREVKVFLPKFKLEDQFELSSTLSRMGLNTLFDARQVDLSDFSYKRDLSVDAVYHKSFVDVNEEGTEAAAATSLITSRSAFNLVPVKFNANNPFVFFIRDNAADVILFMGTVQKPPVYKKK